MSHGDESSCAGADAHRVGSECTRVLANQRVIDAQQTDSLNQIVYKLDIDDRYPIECVALCNALSPPDQGTTFTDLQLTR